LTLHFCLQPVLLILAGGTDEQIARARPILMCMGNDQADGDAAIVLVDDLIVIARHPAHVTHINDASFWLFKGYFDLSV
ncbi:hypothetical protein O5962_28615, partial [Escherichia coli]|nr:hypothetical protein [Escherichia coli]